MPKTEYRAGMHVVHCMEHLQSEPLRETLVGSSVFEDRIRRGAVAAYVQVTPAELAAATPDFAAMLSSAPSGSGVSGFVACCRGGVPRLLTRHVRRGWRSVGLRHMVTAEPAAPRKLSLQCTGSHNFHVRTQ